MARPIKFVTTLSSGYTRAIQINVNIFGDFIALELNEAITHRCSFDLISYQLDRGDACICLKQVLDVGFIHPLLDIANPKCFCIQLLRLLIG